MPRPPTPVCTAVHVYRLLTRCLEHIKLIEVNEGIRVGVKNMLNCHVEVVCVEVVLWGARLWRGCLGSSSMEGLSGELLYVEVVWGACLC